MSLKGFFESMQKSFDEETKRIADRQSRSRYRNVVQRDADAYNNFALQSDGSLLQKYNSDFTSDEDKLIIASILECRGYTKRENGAYSRR